MRRRWLAAFLAFFTCVTWSQTSDHAESAKFNPNLWIEDLRQIQAEMSSHYANLEWAVDTRKMDLPQLRKDTEAKLLAATDEAGARKSLEQFMASFGDGHLEIAWPKATAAPQPKAPAGTPQGPCERLGYNARLKPGLDFSGLPEFSALSTPESNYFPAGLLRLHHGQVIGVIRIGLFSEHAFPAACEEAARDLHMADNAECDDKCADQLEIATGNLLTAGLLKQTDALRAAGARRLLVDITHNGGGSDWVEAATRVLSSVPLHDARMGFIKHKHWTSQFEADLKEVQTDIKNGAVSPLPLNEARAKLERAMAASQQTCNRDAAWETGKFPCSLVVNDMWFASGVFDYAKPGSLSGLQSKEALFSPSLYAYTESARRLPLVVAVDSDTWSAAEYFAALLQDAHAGTVVGEVTGGAGCGHTNGGIPVKLKNSAAVVQMPDCVRYRADGMNEVEGVTPDMLLPWARHDSSFQRAMKLMVALEAQQAVR